MHIVFLGYQGEFEFADSIIGMFVMSLGEFGDIYDTYDQTRYPNMAKVSWNGLLLVAIPKKGVGSSLDIKGNFKFADPFIVKFVMVNLAYLYMIGTTNKTLLYS